MNNTDKNMVVGERRQRGLAKVAEILSKHDIVGRAFNVIAAMEKKGFPEGEMVVFLGSVLDSAKTLGQSKEASHLLQECTPDGLPGEALEGLFLKEMSMHVRTTNQIGFESCIRRMGMASRTGKISGDMNLTKTDSDSSTE